MRIVISSGHGKYIRGAAGSPVPPYLDEVDEARRVVTRVAEFLRARGADVTTYHDNQSHEQSENLHRIVDFHNAHTRDLDVSVHFNAYETTSKAMGTECLYVTQSDLAKRVAAAVAKAGQLIDRGPKKRTDLYFLNNTEMPAILIETCFVDSKADADLYRSHFDGICEAIASTISGIEQPERPDRPERPQPPDRPDRPEIGRGEWHENITATIFGNGDDEQEGAYGGWIDGDTIGIALPYKWRDQPVPEIIVEGPRGSIKVKPVDVGPWNTDDQRYVLGDARPLAELQHDEGIEAQNGRVPTNDAGIDLTLPVAEAVGVSLDAGKGKVRWRYA